LVRVTRNFPFPRSQTPVWERAPAKLRFAHRMEVPEIPRTGVSRRGVPKQEFGNEGSGPFRSLLVLPDWDLFRISRFGFRIRPPSLPLKLPRPAASMYRQAL